LAQIVAIVSIFRHHTSILRADKTINTLLNGNLQFATFGAYPDSGTVRAALSAALPVAGNIIATPNAADDRAIVTGNSPLTHLRANSTQISNLITAAEHYRVNSNTGTNATRYRLRGPNSNSWARSLLLSVNIPLPTMTGNFPGWSADHRIPNSAFGR